MPYQGGLTLDAHEKRYRIPILLLSLTIVLLLAVIGGCLGVIVRLNRNNLFSKSIYTDNNYFLRDQPLSNSDTENIEQEGEIYSDTLIPKTLFRFKQELATVTDDGEESFLYPANEHCMVFTGCENDQYYFADPLKEEQATAYASQDAVRAYNEMGMQAVVIVPTGTTGVTPKQ